MHRTEGRKVKCVCCASKSEMVGAITTEKLALEKKHRFLSENDHLRTVLSFVVVGFFFFVERIIST